MRATDLGRGHELRRQCERGHGTGSPACGLIPARRVERWASRPRAANPSAAWRGIREARDRGLLRRMACSVAQRRAKHQRVACCAPAMACAGRRAASHRKRKTQAQQCRAPIAQRASITRANGSIVVWRGCQHNPVGHGGDATARRGPPSEALGQGTGATHNCRRKGNTQHSMPHVPNR